MICHFSVETLDLVEFIERMIKCPGVMTEVWLVAISGLVEDDGKRICIP